MYNPLPQPLPASQPNSGDPTAPASGITTAPSSQPPGQQIQSLGRLFPHLNFSDFSFSKLRILPKT